MMIAEAGCVTTAGSMAAVQAFYNSNDGPPRLGSINLNDAADDLTLDEDMIVPDNSSIHVPPTQLAKTGGFLDSVLKDLLRFQGFSLCGTIIVNHPSNGTTVVPTH